MAYTIDGELRSQSAYSPGVVQDEEKLLRIIFISNKTFGILLTEKWHGERYTL